MTCQNCHQDVNSIVIHGNQLWCWDCHQVTKGSINKAPYMIGDECDTMIKHGLCWPDGSPRRFRSKSEIKRVAYETGYFQGNDTPKTNHRLSEERQAKREDKHGND